MTGSDRRRMWNWKRPATGSWLCPYSSETAELLMALRPELAGQSLHGQWRRWLKFNLIGAMGVVVHTGSLLAGWRLFHLNYLAATAIAVEAAVIHNFVWHLKWTWADRRLLDQRLVARDVAPTFLRFNASTGAVSLFGNLAMMRVLVGAGHLNLIAATLVSIGLCSLLNFLIADRLIFCKRRRAGRSYDGSGRLARTRLKTLCPPKRSRLSP